VACFWLLAGVGEKTENKTFKHYILTENILAEEKREKYLFRIKLKPVVYNNSNHIVLT
jgi:hypothetical protein